MLIHPWRIEMLGGLSLRQGGSPEVDLKSYLLSRMLAYLAFYPSRAHLREELLALLWPEEDPAITRNRLRVALNHLRHHLEPPGVASGAVLATDRFSIRLQPQSFTTDVMQFEAHFSEALQTTEETQRAQRLQNAVEIYRGPLLPDLYEDWMLAERERLAQCYLQALHRLVRHLASAKEYERALNYAQRALQVDSVREEAHRDVMQLYVALGQPSAALSQYQEAKRLMQETLGVTPSTATRQLAAKIAERLGLPDPDLSLPSRNASDTPAAAPAPAHSVSVAAAPPPATPSPDLPVYLTRFFGREDELQSLTPLLLPCRHTGDAAADAEADGANRAGAQGGKLLTLTGPGGSGKTRISVELTHRLRSAYAGHVCFVPLADLIDPRRIPDAIATTLGLSRSSQTEPLPQVIDTLSRHPYLLVLDNMEQLVEGGNPIVGALLEQIPTLTCLVTSRRILGLDGEQEVALLPLPVPAAAGKPILPAALLGYAGVQLFVDRAQNCLAHFQVTPNNVGDVAALCRKLEGIPLALELAAARVRILTPAQMLVQLEHRFDLLVNRRADKELRHRSLRATLDWSWQLLSPELRRLFARLSVFQGGWSLEALQRVCQDWDALDGLEQLQADSLILVEEAQGERRFRMLETLREFAAEHLSAAEYSELAQRHAHYYLALAEEAEPLLRGTQQLTWLNRLQMERENLEAALNWCRGDPSGGEIGLRLTAALERFWYVRGYIREGRAHFAHALAHPEAQAPTGYRARALNCAGNLALHQSDYTAAQTLFDQSLTLYRDLGERQRTAVVLGNMANIHIVLEQYPPARSLYAEALEIQREVGDLEGIVRNLYGLSMVARKEEDYAEAQRLAEESLLIARRNGDHLHIAALVMHLGIIAMDREDYVAARVLYEESLEIHRRLGNRGAIIPALSNLGYVLPHLAEFDRSRACLMESLYLAREMGMTLAQIYALEYLGSLAFQQKDWELATWLFSLTEAERRRRQTPMGPVSRTRRYKGYATIREAYGEDNFHLAYLRGETADMEKVISDLLQDYIPPA